VAKKAVMRERKNREPMSRAAPVGGRAILALAIAFVACGVALFLFNRGAASAPPPEPPPSFVWSVDFEHLKIIAISLPRKKKQEAWVKHEDQQWYFDRPSGPMVDMQRWGGGVPLILSGPAADRLIGDEPTAAQLKIYGFDDPRMTITLGLDNGQLIHVEVGDSAPDGRTSYVKLADSKSVYSVDQSWYEVLELLVLDPPYPSAGSQAARVNHQ